MEHIVTIAINIDDDDIKAKIEDKITRDVTQQLVDKIFSYILTRYGGVNNAANKIISTAVSQYKQEIIDAAIKDVTLSLKRGSQYKKVLKQIENIGAEIEEYYGNQNQ